MDNTNLENDIDLFDSQVPSLSAAILAATYKEALASGVPVLISRNGGLYEAFADGSYKFVKALPPPLSIPVGTIIQIP